ncbi:pyrimidine utilization protein D [Brevundimonas sp.]|uniref:pyrimidine utilization protein D n=1 Tax=Brevundimonas sp. TaxID=1871086 RepID=UPI00272F524C|nr:pyrimidine utilization protein D [Brevundimonas sp.]MDP1912896.1 pyrimidine utilization protein D [Brevundimonas sp.]
MVRTGRADGVHYEIHSDGPDDVRDVVILSAGLAGSGAFWAPQMVALTARFRVVLYDHRGTGRSDRALPAPYAVSDMARDIAGIIEALGEAAVHVVGHAAGGLAGLRLALDSPSRVLSVAVINGWSRPDRHVARCFRTRISLLNDSGPEAYVHAQPLFLYPADWISQNAARLAEEEVHHLAGFQGRENMLARIHALLAFDIDDRLGEVACPVLVSASADDMLVPALCSRRLAERLPNATLDIAPWGGHAFTATVPDAFNATLIAFLCGEPLPC